MKSYARGRIVIWEGASLWAFDSPPETSARRSTDVHSHHALQFTFAVDGAFEFRIGRDTVAGPAVLIAPDVAHSYRPKGRNAMIFVEPESRAGAAVLRRLSGQPFARLDPAQFVDLTDPLSRIWEQPRPSDSSLVELGLTLTGRLIGEDLPQVNTDARIARVLARLRQNVTLDLAEAAGIACLSESRFSHLFVAHVGLPFRTYLLWRRLMHAVDLIVAGGTLTDAAHGAGFADSAHFSRTFIRMFGVPASLLALL